jgi:hypothetical protein
MFSKLSQTQKDKHGIFSLIQNLDFFNLDFFKRRHKNRSQTILEKGETSGRRLGGIRVGNGWH